VSKHCRLEWLEIESQRIFSQLTIRYVVARVIGKGRAQIRRSERPAEGVWCSRRVDRNDRTMCLGEDVKIALEKGLCRLDNTRRGDGGGILIGPGLISINELGALLCFQVHTRRRRDFHPRRNWGLSHVSVVRDRRSGGQTACSQLVAQIVCLGRLATPARRAMIENPLLCNLSMTPATIAGSSSKERFATQE
jgi:hypothetical protein